MRTFTVVPSFDGESAFFDLPDIGFQGDHLSFAILFNLTELTEHWPDILPSMIVTDPKGNTYIAPHTRWNSDKHIFTWLISSTETTYDGYLKCQLKCISADDPETIVCMSRICQTRVYQSLEAEADPPEAFQTWIDTLVQLGAEINADASVILDAVETTENNARVAQEAADSAEQAKTSAQQARNSVEQTAQAAVAASNAAVQAQQRAASSAQAALEAKNATEQAKADVDAALEEADRDVRAAQTAATTATDAAEQATSSMTAANVARNETYAARDAAVAAKDRAVTAQEESERIEHYVQEAVTGTQAAQAAAEEAQEAAESAQSAAEAAQAAAQQLADSAIADADRAEAARDRAELARDGVEYYADKARRWAEGKDYQGHDVPDTDEAYENNSKWWAAKAEENASIMYSYMADIQENVGIVQKIELEIRPQDWQEGVFGKYNYYVDIEDNQISNTELPLIALDEASLEIASNSMVCATIRSYNGFVRIRSEELPEDTIRGMLYMFGDGLKSEFVPPSADDIGVATDEDVNDMIYDVFDDDDD